MAHPTVKLDSGRYDGQPAEANRSHLTLHTDSPDAIDDLAEARYREAKMQDELRALVDGKPLYLSLAGIYGASPDEITRAAETGAPLIYNTLLEEVRSGKVALADDLYAHTETFGLSIESVMVAEMEGHLALVGYFQREIDEAEANGDSTGLAKMMMHHAALAEDMERNLDYRCDAIYDLMAGVSVVDPDSFMQPAYRVARNVRHMAGELYHAAADKVKTGAENLADKLTHHKHTPAHIE